MQSLWHMAGIKRVVDASLTSVRSDLSSRAAEQSTIGTRHTRVEIN